MNIQCALICSLIATTPVSLPPSSELGQTIEIQRFGLYV